MYIEQKKFYDYLIENIETNKDLIEEEKLYISSVLKFNKFILHYYKDLIRELIISIYKENSYNGCFETLSKIQKDNEYIKLDLRFKNIGNIDILQEKDALIFKAQPIEYSLNYEEFKTYNSNIEFDYLELKNINFDKLYFYLKLYHEINSSFYNLWLRNESNLRICFTTDYMDIIIKKLPDDIEYSKYPSFKIIRDPYEKEASFFYTLYIDKHFYKVKKNKVDIDDVEDDWDIDLYGPVIKNSNTKEINKEVEKKDLYDKKLITNPDNVYEDLFAMQFKLEKANSYILERNKFNVFFNGYYKYLLHNHIFYLLNKYDMNEDLLNLMKNRPENEYLKIDLRYKNIGYIDIIKEKNSIIFKPEIVTYSFNYDEFKPVECFEEDYVLKLDNIDFNIFKNEMRPNDTKNFFVHDFTDTRLNLDYHDSYIINMFDIIRYRMRFVPNYPLSKLKFSLAKIAHSTEEIKDYYMNQQFYYTLLFRNYYYKYIEGQFKYSDIYDNKPETIELIKHLNDL